MHITTGGGFHDYALDLQKCSLHPKLLKESLRRFDRNFVIEVLKANGAALCHLDKSFAKDRDLVLIGVQKISKRSDLQNHQHLYADRTVMLNAIQSCADCMKLVGPLKTNRAFVLEAVRFQPDAYHLAAEELKRDEEIIRTALTETASYEKERAAEESKQLMDETEDLVNELLTDLDPEFGIKK